MGIVGKALTTLVLIGVSWGALTWLGDGRQPLQEGWFNAVTTKVEQWIDFNEDTARNKVPDPGTLPLPDIGEVAPLEDRGGDFTQIAPSGLPDFAPAG